MAPIHDAIEAFDVAALRRELAAGVSPELNADALPESESDDGGDYCTPLYLAVIYASAYPKSKLEERIAMVAALLEAGAAVNARSYSRTALHAAVSINSGAFGDIIDMLLAANADLNAVDDDGHSVVATAAGYGHAPTVKKLISAGARDLDGALVAAVSVGSLRNCAPLLRAGAALPAEDRTDRILRTYESRNHPRRRSIIRARTYIAKISGTPGGFKAYEREHRRRLTAVFANKFPALPVEVISHIVLLWAHCGDYDYQDYAPPRAEHWRMVSEQIEREREAAAANSEEE